MIKGYKAVSTFWGSHTLREASGISSASIAKLGKGDNITTEVLLRICEALDCDISDIMEVVKDAPVQQQKQ